MSHENGNSEQSARFGGMLGIEDFHAAVAAGVAGATGHAVSVHPDIARGQTVVRLLDGETVFSDCLQ